MNIGERIELGTQTRYVEIEDGFLSEILGIEKHDARLASGILSEYGLWEIVSPCVIELKLLESHRWDIVVEVESHATQTGFVRVADYQEMRGGTRAFCEILPSWVL